MNLDAVYSLAHKVARVHGDHNPKLRALAIDVTELRDTLGDPPLDRHSVRALFTRIRSDADDFVVPEWGCGSYQALFVLLAELEGELSK